jgi:hypothetical protein
LNFVFGSLLGATANASMLESSPLGDTPANAIPVTATAPATAIARVTASRLLIRIYRSLLRVKATRLSVRA